MFRYFLAFLLINTCYQSLGNPIQPRPPNQLLSNSLATLADQCKSDVLKKHILEKIHDCTVSVPPYSKKQIQCLIFYDMSMQLCSDAATLKITDDPFVKLEEKQDVNAVCTLAKEWVFTNISAFLHYKESAEKYLKLPANCGILCGLEDTVNEANYYCKYYKMGLELLKFQHSTTMANANNNAVAAPVIPEPDSSAKVEAPAPGNSDPVKPNGQIKQTEPAVAKTTPQKVEDAAEEAVAKSETVAQATSKQTLSGEEADNPDNIEDSDINVNKPVDSAPVPVPENVIPHNDQFNKTGVVQAEKPAVVDEVAAPDLPVLANSDQKPAAVIDNPKPKAIGDEDYDSEGNEPDEENEETGPENKPDIEPANQQTFTRNKLVVPVAHEAEVSQKEFFPNSMPDDFSDQDNDHFFPFFMTSVILMVLLYVLYHNKSKVSKVFFGLILEGRQSGRRRNSRGHAYRRLDTLEQAMNANTAAPPSKIIY